MAFEDGFVMNAHHTGVKLIATCSAFSIPIRNVKQLSIQIHLGKGKFDINDKQLLVILSVWQGVIFYYPIYVFGSRKRIRKSNHNSYRVDRVSINKENCTSCLDRINLRHEAGILLITRCSKILSYSLHNKSCVNKQRKLHFTSGHNQSMS